MNGSGAGATIAVLSLVVTTLVAFVAPFVTWTVARQNIVTTARETWMREFREQVVGLIISTAALESHQIALVRGEASLSEKEKRRAEITKEMMQHYQTLVLLIAEKGPQYDWFIEKMQNRMRAEQPESVNASRARAEFTKGAEGVLKAERAAIEKPELRCILRTSFWLKSLTR